ncbi:MAG: hypothetical protein AMXMBFR37_05830 [Steroidobacteraceae bacterium]
MKSNAFIENTTVRQDVYTRVTAKVIADLEAGVRTWMKPWSGDNAAGKINIPLRHCGTPYRGINILLLWGEALERGYPHCLDGARDRPGGAAG